MVLGFNIGNTRTLMGIYDDDNPEPVYTHAYPTYHGVDSQELSHIIRSAAAQFNSDIFTAVSGAAYSNVVPQTNGLYDKIIHDLFSVTAHRIHCSSTMPIAIEYDNPAQLGADRIVNAVAAFTDYHTDCIIVDIGTAITFCLLQDGILKGGLIAPGIQAAIRGLSTSTAQLFDVPFEKPQHLIAKNTKDALISGFFYGWVSLVEGIVQKMQSTAAPAAILCTGGMADQLCPHLSASVIIDTSLTMRGIYYVCRLNRNNTKLT